MSESHPVYSLEKGVQDAAPLHRFSHDAMATTFEIVIVGEDGAYAEQAAMEAFDEIDRLEREMSRFVEFSDVSQVNTLEAEESVVVGIATFECLRIALEVSEQTSGAFDVTFGKSRLRLEEESIAVAAETGQPQIDLGGIGKGYALDHVAGLLQEWEIGRAILHSGQSTVRTLTPYGAEEGWPLSIRDPEEHGRILGSLQLRNESLSGSGLLLHGKHIIDPRTGQPADSKVGTWAIAPSAAHSDALSTAFMVMAPEEVEQYCRSHPDVSGLLLVPNGDDRQLLPFGEILKAFAPQG